MGAVRRLCTRLCEANDAIFFPASNLRRSLRATVRVSFNLSPLASDLSCLKWL